MYKAHAHQHGLAYVRAYMHAHHVYRPCNCMKPLPSVPGIEMEPCEETKKLQ